MVRPVEREADLQKLNELPEWRIRPKFLEQVSATRNIVLNQVKAKKVNGQYLDGPRFLALTEAYVSHINNGNSPCIENAWEHVRKFENQKTTRRLVERILNNVHVSEARVTDQNSESAQFGISVDLLSMFANGNQLNVPHQLKGKIEKLSQAVISSRSDYSHFKEALTLIYEYNILGGATDNADLIEDFMKRVDRRMENKFQLVDKKVEKAASEDLKYAIQQETEIFFQKEDLELSDFENSLENSLKIILEKYSQYLGQANNVETRIRSLFDREKGRSLAKLLSEIQNRQEMQREAERIGEMERKFRAEEERKKMEDEIERVRVQMEVEKDKCKESTKQRLKIQIRLDEALAKVAELESQLGTIKGQNVQSKNNFEDKIKLLETEKSEAKNREINLEREIMILNQKCEMQTEKINEIQAEIEHHQNERNLQEKRAIDAEQTLKATVEEFERERGNKVVMDNEQLKLLEDKLQDSTDRALTAENALKEKHTETELLKAQLEIMEQKFNAIEIQNREFLEEMRNRVNELEAENGGEINRNLAQALETFAIWKKVLRICNLFQCGKCAKFVPKKGIWSHLNRCLSSTEKKILGFQNDEETAECLLRLGIQPTDPHNSNHPHQHCNHSKEDEHPTEPLLEPYELKIVQSLIREQQVEGEARPYTEYIFRVRGAESGEEWHVARKFKEFCQLLLDLQERHKEIELPEECAELWDYISNIWGLIGNSEVNQDRRVELIDSMMSVMACRKDILSTPVFAEFLCLRGKHQSIV